MLRGKTIQMDPDMIEDIQKIMVAENNFSFQAVTRNIIKIGLREIERKAGFKDGGAKQRNL